MITTKLPIAEAKETVCSCLTCQDMCKKRACWGKPEELQKIVVAGYGKQLMLDWWQRTEGDILILSGAESGREGQHAGSFPGGRCTFLTEKSLCMLHDLGLKPIEGRVAHCQVNYDIHEEVAMLWRSPEARKIVEDWQTKFMGNEDD